MAVDLHVGLIGTSRSCAFLGDDKFALRGTGKEITVLCEPPALSPCAVAALVEFELNRVGLLWPLTPPCAAAAGPVLTALWGWRAGSGPVTLYIGGTAVQLNVSTRNVTPCWTNAGVLAKALGGLGPGDFVVLAKRGGRVEGCLAQKDSEEAAAIRRLWAEKAETPSRGKRSREGAKQGSSKRQRRGQERSEGGEQEQQPALTPASKKKGGKREREARQQQQEQQTVVSTPVSTPQAARCQRTPYCVKAVGHVGRCKVRPPAGSTPGSGKAQQDAVAGLIDLGGAAPSAQPAHYASAPLRKQQQREQQASGGAAKPGQNEDKGKKQMQNKAKVATAAAVVAPPQHARQSQGAGPSTSRLQPAAAVPARRYPTRAEKGKQPEGQLAVEDPERLFGADPSGNVRGSFRLAQLMSDLEASGRVSHRTTADYDAVMPYDPGGAQMGGRHGMAARMGTHLKPDNTRAASSLSHHCSVVLPRSVSVHAAGLPVPAGPGGR